MLVVGGVLAWGVGGMLDGALRATWEATLQAWAGRLALRGEDAEATAELPGWRMGVVERPVRRGLPEGRSSEPARAEPGGLPGEALTQPGRMVRVGAEGSAWWVVAVQVAPGRDGRGGDAWRYGWAAVPAEWMTRERLSLWLFVLSLTVLPAGLVVICWPALWRGPGLGGV